MGMNDYRWEYSPLAQAGNYIWKHAVDPMLCFFAKDETTAWLRVRGVIQILVAGALLAFVTGLFWNRSHMMTASGLLFDMAGALRLFLVEEITTAFEPFKDKDPIPSIAMREIIMPEASGPYDSTHDYIHLFWYRRRGILFLFVGFALQMVGDFLP